MLTLQTNCYINHRRVPTLSLLLPEAGVESGVKFIVINNSQKADVMMNILILAMAVTEHIGLVVRMSILDTKGRRFEPQHQYVFSLSKRLYPHCFSRLSCEMSTRWGHPREGCSVL